MDTSFVPELLADILERGTLRSVFQPIIELSTGRVVAYESLVRGPEGPLSSPDALFAAARESGRLAELDQACRRSAITHAARLGFRAPTSLFVNVEPETLGSASVDDPLALATRTAGGLPVVLEITERALAARPAELLRTVDRVREFGWAIALDDVGADPASLAFMPLLQPDVVKLDLRLVQERPTPAIAQIMNAVNAYAERTGALVLAEGIEDAAHLAFAQALGATIGQGWLFGRPAARPAHHLAPGALHLATRAAARLDASVSPFACLPSATSLRRAPKSLLVAVSKQLERDAMSLGDTCVVASTFQQARHFTAATGRRYRALVDRVNFVCALGRDLPTEPLPGLRGAALDAGDAICGEWDIVVLSPHFAAALLARDLGDGGPDPDRTFEYALTYERDAVTNALRALLSRVAPLSDTRAGHEGSAEGPRKATPDASLPVRGTSPTASFPSRRRATAGCAAATDGSVRS